ncbi:amidohydrolase family protein [Pyrobaculum neutrophilum]|uniref:Dihydroorotase, multifunctional complex type n=1 Tax=Pyrobaculum neutrophilum (strain DSM 2338 / JCM 9278 / NBRC 100436 / V24Sta) TaxID=444157 RepID=B1YE00_PYRNV|nr:amidohydrolase family protein [Pyrobaculum neutrophilum]ACB40013.1 dihydroorotase, multifunctional complex type [Pyrobaculum neutrophilum V24Sta]
MCIAIEGRVYLGGRLARFKLGRGKTLQFSNRHLVLPGMVDIHVHFRGWELSYKETLEGGAAAALAGGVVAVGDMPNTRPHIRTAELYRRRMEEGSRLPVVYRLHMGVPRDLAELDAARPPTVKVYPEDVAEFGWGHVEALMRRCAGLGCAVVFHCEDPSLFRDGERPPEAELACVEKVRRLAVDTGARVHLTHVSLPQTVDAARGWATVDVTPHHLLLDRENCRLGGLCLVNPRLREPRQRRELLARLAAGLVDMYATDHAPHALEEKLSAAPPPGICSLEVALPLLLSLWRRGVIALEDVVRLYSYRPARFLGVNADPTAGYFTVVRLEEFAVRGEEFAGTCRHTPFEGFKAFGRVVATAVGGRVYFRDGEVEELC